MATIPSAHLARAQCYGRAQQYSLTGNLLLLIGALSAPASERAPVSHSFLAAGAETRIIAADGSTTRSFGISSRDGWMLPNKNVLLAVSKGKEFPGGGVVEINPQGDVVFEYRGSQEEVNTVQWLDAHSLLLTEAGPKPRILEIDRQGRTLVEVPIACQITNFHMQSRMTRKLANGHYLVPQLLDRVVREYAPSGSIVWEVSTPHWPFTAIRLKNGNTLIGCTYGNLVIEVNRRGRVVWQVSNEDLAGNPIKDACGVHRLANGNTVITSYGAGAQRIKMIEVDRKKKLRWVYESDDPQGIHHFQILNTSGRPLAWPPLR